MGNYIFGLLFFFSDIKTQNELFGSYLKVLNSEQKQGGKATKVCRKKSAVILQ